ncbi:MAG: hypothetical protein IPG82_19430 [Saprospiraceae bacterium]|nr:hypothetical protein [Saprospiraceae bacterium]
MVQLESDYQIAQKNAELLKKEVEITNQKNQRNILKVIVLSAFFILLALSYFYLRIKKTNQLLGVKNTEINRQKNTLEDTLLHLKTTQAQLIQSEKMASLGELTAGIAHEIQNPLNFVNNFSELNTELVGELIEELKKGIRMKPLTSQRISLIMNKKSIITVSGLML